MMSLTKILMEKKIFIFLILFFITLAGIISYKNLNIDVFPDPSPVLVQVFTEADGMAPEEVEKFISYPIETALYGLPHIKKITSASAFGLSTVNVYFSDKMDFYFARQLVSQEIPSITSKLPDFAESPTLGPITTGLGMVYVYAIEGDNPGIEIRTLQDWVIKFQLQSIPGIAAIQSHGGEVKQFQILVDPNQMIKYQLDLHDLISKVKESSLNITAGYITKNREEYLIRGVGLFDQISALRKVIVKEIGSTPIFLENLAEIKIGAAIKRGEATLNKKRSVVAGIVMKLIGVNTSQLINQIHAQVEEINQSLPEGVRLVPVYNQAMIIRAAFRTVSDALLFGIILVAIILLLFIKDTTAALVSTLSVPFAVFITFIIMKFTNMSADLMSFGGLAIGIGLLVDATVVVVENISRNLENQSEGTPIIETILSSLQEVIKPLSYAMVIIILSFLPILTLTGVEGKMFRPFGLTLVIAISAAILYALMISPVLMGTFRRKKANKASKGSVFEKLKALYLKIFDFSFKREKSVLVIFTTVFLISVVILMLMGSEFIPRLNEQIIQLETLLPKNTSLEETEQALAQVHKIVQKFPQVENVFTRIGRGEAGTHPHPVNMGHSMITLKEKKFGTQKRLNELIHQIENQINHTIPGASLNFTQPIKHNLDHLITGVRADLAVKIYGSDYNTLLRLAGQTKGILEQIKGVKDAQVSRVSGQNEIEVTLSREQLSRYGLNPAEVLEELEASFGGKNIAKAYVDDIVYDVFIRFASPYRKNITDLSRHLIHSNKGHMIPLSAVADIQEDSTGFAEINRENGKRYISVQCNVRGRDIGSLVKESKTLIFKELDIPMGYFVSWGGQFELKEKAESKLILIISITLILIIIILFDYFRGWKDIVIILANLPVSLSGGILSLWLAGAFISVPSIIGFLALLGIALENTLVLITFFKRKISNSANLDQAIRESVSLRLRPILMTKFTTIIGLFPLLLSAGIGSEVQRPLAIVVVGGIFFSIFTTLILMPILYKMLYRSDFQKV